MSRREPTAVERRERRLVRAYCRGHPWRAAILMFCVIFTVMYHTCRVADRVWPTPGSQAGLPYSMAVGFACSMYVASRRLRKPERTGTL